MLANFLKNVMEECKAIEEWGVEKELNQAIDNGTFETYRKRAEGESKGFLYGESCNWDREKMIEYFLSGPSAWLGRETFEKSFDSGKMKEMAKIYHDALNRWNSL